MTTLDEQITAWTKAEQAGDTDLLDTLLHPQFLAVGPYGSILDRDQWKARFCGRLHYEHSGWDEEPDRGTGNRDVRASDAERHAVVDKLGEHLRAGRLDLDELGDRTERALAARNRRDLDRLLTDLPPIGQTPPQPRPRGWPFLLLAGLALVAIATTITIAVTARHGFWFLWWLIPIGFFIARRFRRRTWTVRSDGAPIR